MMKLLKLLPGMSTLPEGLEAVGEQEMKKVEVLIQSMTPAERRNPDVINRSRRMRIAKGAHREETDVQELMKRFQMMRTMIANMNRNGGLGALGSMMGLGGAQTGGVPGAVGSNGNFYQPPRMAGPSEHARKEQQKRLEKKKQAKQARKKNRH
jgi:signal recognition particle subunit SRP54